MCMLTRKTRVDEAISRICDIMETHERNLERDVPLLTALNKLLKVERFQKRAVIYGNMPTLASLIRKTYGYARDSTKPADEEILSGLCTDMTWRLYDLTQMSIFRDTYSVNDGLVAALTGWLVDDHEQVQLCACILLQGIMFVDEASTTFIHGQNNRVLHKIHQVVTQSCLRGSSSGMYLG